MVAIVFDDACEAAAGRVPIGAGSLEGEAMAFGGFPVDAGEPSPLRGVREGRAEQAAEGFKHLRVFGERRAEVLVPSCAPSSCIWSLVGWAKKLPGHFTVDIAESLR